MHGLGKNFDETAIKRRVRAANYLVVAQLYLKSNFLLEHDLKASDIKPRLLGHWGTCAGINKVYANLKSYFGNDPNFTFVIGPGHGFPALQANLFIDGDLEKVDPKATRDSAGIAYICKNFSWPGGFPSHASPVTPNVICEGGELGYALATSYGYSLGHPERMTAVLIGDGEFETATTIASLNLNRLLSSAHNGKVLPILHLNGYKISAPTLSARRSQRELHEQIRGFGYEPIEVKVDSPEGFQTALAEAMGIFAEADRKRRAGVDKSFREPFIIYRNEKGSTGPEEYNDQKIAGNFLAHQIPLKDPTTNEEQLAMLENWLKSYRFHELFNKEKGFTL